MEYIAHNANSWCSRSVAGDAELALLDRCIGYSPVPVLPFGDQFLPTVKSEVDNDDEYEIWNLPNSADGDLIKYEIVPEAAIIPSELIHFESEPVVVPPFTCNPDEEKSNRKGRSKEKKAKEQSVRKPRPRRAVAIKEKSQRNPKQRKGGRKAKETTSKDSTSESVIFTRTKKMDETERQILERHLQWIDEEEETEPLPKGRDENWNLEPFNTASPIPITCESNDTEYMIL